MIKEKINKICMVLIIILTGTPKAFSAEQPNTMRIAVLIICSDNKPIYKHLQESCKKFMHSDPEHIDAYFLRGDPSIQNICEIRGDTIYAQTEESINPGLQNKTILALEHILSQEKKYDYIIRANLSTFYIFPRLLEFLNNCPKTRYYAGPIMGMGFASGSGFIMSRDVAKLAAQHKNHFFNNSRSLEDVLFGVFFRNHGIALQEYPFKAVYTLEDWNTMKDRIGSNIFQFRVFMNNRMNELIVRDQLINMFYSS